MSPNLPRCVAIGEALTDLICLGGDQWISKTGGSTFKNPEGAKAWELVDQAGCRGLIVGGAQVSEKHCNFLLNLGEATSADIEELGEEVRRRVKAKSGVTLEWEIQRVGTCARAPDDKRVGNK